ncbi:MAG: DUF4279 domain-containing protein [Thermoanaerobaculia bacterium]|nr:DUF4279 domain-containing protein [Thermoanaerobaculia bacterium]
MGEILGLEATRSFRKGDRRGVRSPPYPHDMWAYTPSVDERSILDLHIQGLWAAIRGRASEIRDLAKCVTVDVFCTYSSNGPIGGFDISVESLELFKELDIPLGVSIVVFEEDGSDSEAFDGMVDLLENPTTH